MTQINLNETETIINNDDATSQNNTLENNENLSINDNSKNIINIQEESQNLQNFNENQQNRTLINIESENIQLNNETFNNCDDYISLSTYKLYILKRFLLCFLIYLIVFALIMTRNYWYLKLDEENLEDKIQLTD